MSKAYLVLSNGAVFAGTRFGAAGETLGELVFTTNMGGYIETLTDPSYYGQIVLQTFPLIGNYGMIEADQAGSCYLKGYVVREWCDSPSNFRTDYDLDTYLKQQGVVGLCGVDTRAITKIIREHGTMSACICDELPADQAALDSYQICDALAATSRQAEQCFAASGNERYRVTLVDYGASQPLIAELQNRGCQVRVVPHHAGAADILSGQPHGILLGNGPGNPAENQAEIATLKQLLGQLPMFGVDLGHQLLALAQGGETYKLKYGHRGASQPVREVGSNRTFITSQNHGYAVRAESVPGAQPLFANANDGSCEGLSYPALQAFSVQFQPQTSADPRDTAYLFDRFISMLGGAADAAK